MNWEAINSFRNSLIRAIDCDAVEYEIDGFFHLGRPWDVIGHVLDDNDFFANEFETVKGWEKASEVLGVPESLMDAVTEACADASRQERKQAALEACDKWIKDNADD